jgi:glycosyltransferase involved in cell wall biosynthesis
MNLEALALTIIALHFAAPLAYYRYVKRYLDKPWNIEFDPGYSPKVAVILPTYNEVDIIANRLDNLKLQDYPMRLLKVVVVDCSIDGTAEVVEEWSKENRDLDLELVREHERSGKLHALETSLKHVSSDFEVLIFTDADASWEREALCKAMKYLADPSVGCLTSNITYTENQNNSLEKTYRSYYNVIRVAESKIHSTPVHNGPFLALRAQLVDKTGLPKFEGSDDSAFGSFTAFMGYRAIQADDITIQEPITENQHLRRMRRAQHLILSFLKTKSYTKRVGLYRRSRFDEIWKTEWWLHVGNPWLLVIGIVLLVTSFGSQGSVIALAVMVTGLLLMASRPYRTWVTQQVYLVMAMLRNLWTKDVMWTKYHPKP